MSQVSKIEEQDPRFKYIETKLGIMALVAVLGIVLLVAFVGKERDVFTKKFHLYFIAANGRGMSTNMPVKLSGFKVGKVKRMELAEKAVVKVTMEIDSKYQQWIRSGSKASLVKEGFIGEPFIDLTGGSEDGAVLADGEFVPFKRRAGLVELINAAKPAFNEIKEMIHYANDPGGDIKTTIANISALTTELKGARAELADTVRSTAALMEEISKKSGPVLDSTSSVMKNLEGVTARLEPMMERMDAITERAEAATTRLPETAASLDAVVENMKTLTGMLASESPAIREMLTDAGETLGDAREVVGGVKKSWPVRLMVPPVKGPELVPLDAFKYGSKAHEADGR